jgi:hypothetical protein
MGGKITAASTVGAGSIFTVSFKLVVPETRESPGEEPRSIAKSA